MNHEVANGLAIPDGRHEDLDTDLRGLTRSKSFFLPRRKEGHEGFFKKYISICVYTNILL